MNRDKHLAAVLAVLVAAACLIALTWVGTMRTIHAQRLSTEASATATLANQALTFTEQVNRQILALDQTLRILVTAWQANPSAFDLEAWRKQATVLSGLSRDMVLTDENGIIRQSSVNEAINQNANRLDYFRALSSPADADDPSANSQPDKLQDKLYVGPATIDGIMRQWHMNVARALRYPDGSFAGVIDADYRIAAITDVFGQTNLGTGAFIALVGLDDGKLRGAFGPAILDPDASVSDTPMFAAIQDVDSGVWTGPSPNDAVRRIHAFRHIAGRNLAVVVGMREDEALRPATEWRRQAEFLAGCITASIVAIALLVVRAIRLGRRRGLLVAEDRAALAASNAQLEVARALAAAKAEQLEATLAGMTDGVSVFDGHVCLVEWNVRFPEVAGVPPEILRVGLPMEEILRAQIKTGQFGAISDPEAEVMRRMGRLGATRFSVVQRQRPDGRTLELRRNRLPDGGFVTLYTDITEHKLAEEALRTAQADAEAANAAKSRFVAIVSHEIRSPLNALLNAVRLLGGSTLAPAQESLLAMARQSGDVLLGLINDVLDMSQMDAGTVPNRPSVFELRPLLDSCAEMFAGQAAARGIAIHVAVAEGTPAMLLADPGLLRQVQLNLLSNAVKYARAGEIWLMAAPGNDDDEAVRITVRDDGPVMAPDARARLFRLFSPLEPASGEDIAGTGLGLSISRQMMDLMGGKIGYDMWRHGDARHDAREQAHGSHVGAREGNAFWVALPATASTVRFGSSATDGPIAPATGSQPPISALPRRPSPRMRLLLAGDIVASQVATATLLRREGHRVDTVSSGQAAVEAVRTACYDLVLMDILMPGIGGQGATQIIRALPEPARSVPVIALAANASPEDEASFTAAGMDGMLRKPVSLERLLDALRTYPWSRRTGGLEVADAGNSRTRPDLPGPTAILALERIEELRANRPPEIFANLVVECLVDMDHRLPALRRAMTAAASAAVAAHAHALVGLAAGYGMVALEARLRSIIAAAQAGDAALFGPAMIALLENDFSTATTTLRALLEHETAMAQNSSH